MASIVKETEAQTTTAGRGTAPAPTQPVALEVSVTVNGARTVEGSDKREPFSETTKTVLIFGHGAVIRLASSVAPGQLLFLTNENSKKEVVCQVVKSKNYRNVSGYVELEFTEPAPGFWGVRFVGERSSTSTQHSATPPTVASGPRAAPSVARTGAGAPSALQTKPSEAKPATTAAPNTTKTTAQIIPEKSAAPKLATPSITRPLPAVQPQTTAPVSASVIDFPRAPESKPASFLEEPRSATGSFWQAPETNTETLKQEAARLQAQLSSLLFAEAAAEEAKAAAPKAAAQAFSETASKVSELAHKEEKPTPTAAPPAEEKQEIPAPKSGIAVAQRSSLDLEAEEVKIPAWLEPLARNSPAPVAAPPARTKPEISEEVNESLKGTPDEDPIPANEDPEPAFGMRLLKGESEETAESAARNSGKGLLIGALAAGLILAAAGGVWYYRLRVPTAAPASTSAGTFATLPASASVANTNPASNADSATTGNTSGPVEVKPASPAKHEEASARTASPAGATSSLSAEAAKELVKLESAKRLQEASARPTVAETEKKPSLGNVQLAAPVVNSPAPAEQQVAAPGVNLGSDLASSGDPTSASLIAGHPNEPKAPVPIGGDVKTARLLHAVPPIYPQLARTQHVSGDVQIDAFIDATGHVTTMKVLSGPVLLHQAAKDAVRQWRYQPAMLDGKPVPMHLTVTVQFRMQ